MASSSASEKTPSAISEIASCQTANLGSGSVASSSPRSSCRRTQCRASSASPQDWASATIMRSWSAHKANRLEIAWACRGSSVAAAVAALLPSKCRRIRANTSRIALTAPCCHSLTCCSATSSLVRRMEGQRPRALRRSCGARALGASLPMRMPFVVRAEPSAARAKG